MAKELKKEFENRLFMYPSDAHYIQALAHQMKIPAGDEYKLFSIMGAQELADTLPLADYRDFQYLIPDDTHFRFNLHLHTHHSDGVLSVKDVLSQAVQIANKNARLNDNLPPFTVAFTDHNNLDALYQALQMIIENPTRYQNLRIVLGCELGAVWREESSQKIPFEFELIYYGLNPFDKSLNDYLNKHLQMRQRATDLVFEKLKTAFPQAPLSKQEAFAQDPLLEKNVSFWYARRINTYAQQKINDREKNAKINEICYALNHSFNPPKEADPYQPYTDLFELQHLSGFGFLGVAHPPKINVGNFLSQPFINECEARHLDAGYEMVYRLLILLKNQGLRALEINYQFDLPAFQESQKMLTGEIPVNPSESTYPWLKFFADFADKYGMLKTGGYDTHKDKITAR